MGDEMLADVCELAFDVAKEGDAPSAMKNYLYLAQRPRRAYSVAQRVLEEDSAFRMRVAERATPESVGEAGYLWLHRPSGWEGRFSEVSSLSDAPVGDISCRAPADAGTTSDGSAGPRSRGASPRSCGALSGVHRQLDRR